MPAVIGIDPDAAGGLCRIDGDRVVVVALRLADDAANRAVLGEHVCAGDVVWLEGIPPIARNGHVGVRTQSQRWGALRERLAMLGADVHEVQPVRWQSALGLTAGRGEGRPAHKARMVAHARRSLPGVTAAHADAYLIARFGEGQMLGNVTHRATA